MKQLYTIITILTFSAFSYSQAVYINEINYSGNDSGIEIEGESGINLNNYTLYFYDGTSRKVYMTYSLSGTIPNIQNNIGVLWFEISNISVGHPKGAGIALVDTNGNLVEFLSYGASFEAKDGPAKNMGASINIGVVEADNNSGKSLQKKSSNWEGPIDATPGTLNTNETLSVVKNQIDGFAVYPNPIAEGKISIKSNTRADKHVEIYSIVGNRVYEKTVKDNETIYISNLTEGIYLMHVEEEGKIATRKLVIK